MIDKLPGQPVDIPLPPDADRAFGYPYDARFVSLRWSFDDVIFDDGRSSGSGASWVFAQYARHRAVFPLLTPLTPDDGMMAEFALVIDRTANKATIAPVAEARAFLRAQHPESDFNEEQRKAIGQWFEGLVGKGWEEVPVDQAEIARRMAEQRGRVGRLMSWLDQCPAAPEQRGKP